jgi:hypothetical protein
MPFLRFNHSQTANKQVELSRRFPPPWSIKVKNPNAPAVKREAEEDWGAVTLIGFCLFGRIRLFADSA